MRERTDWETGKRRGKEEREREIQGGGCGGRLNTMVLSKGFHGRNGREEKEKEASQKKLIRVN